MSSQDGRPPHEVGTGTESTDRRTFWRAFRDQGGPAQIVIGVITTVLAAGVLAGFGLLAGAWRNDNEDASTFPTSESSPAADAAVKETGTSPPSSTALTTSTSEEFAYLPGDGLPVVEIASVSELEDVSQIVAHEGAVWALSRNGTRLLEIDQSTGVVVRRQIVNAGVQVADVVYGEGSLWAASMDSMSLVRFDPYSQDRDVIPLSVTPTGLAISEPTRQAFVIAEDSDVVLRIDLNTSSITGELDVESPSGIIIGPGGDVWVSSRFTDTVIRIDPSAPGPMTIGETVGVSFGPAALATDQSEVWVANVEAGSLSRIQVSTDAPSTVIETIEYGVSPDRILLIDDLVWIFDLAARSIILGGNGFASLEKEPVDVASDGSTAWVAFTDEVTALQT